MITELEACKLLIESAGYGMELNINDIFAWGCADSEELCGDDAVELIPVIQKYGYTALIAYASVKRQGATPQAPVLKDIKEDFYAAKAEIEKLASDGTILYEEFYDMQKRRKDLVDFGGQTASWSSFSNRFQNIVYPEGKGEWVKVLQLARLKDGTLAVGRSISETRNRLKRNYDRRKARKNEIRQ